MTTKSYLLPTMALLAAGWSSIPPAVAIVSASDLRVVLTDGLTQVSVKNTRANQTAISADGVNYANLGANDIFQNSGPGLRVNGAWATGYTRFEPVALAAPGDQITLQLTVRYENAPASIGGALRIGLYDSKRDTATLFPQNPHTNRVGDSAAGYFVTINTGGSDQTNFYRDPGDRTVTKGNATFTTSGDNRVVGFKGAVFGTDPQLVRFIIERTARGLRFSGDIAGVPFTIGNEKLIGDRVADTFDTLVFGSGNLPGAFVVTNIKIMTNTQP